MNRGARATAAGIVTIAVVIAAHPHRQPVPASARAFATVTSDPAVTSVAASFATAVGDVDMAHPHGDLTVLTRVTAPALLAAIRAAQPAVPPGALRRVHVIDVAAVGESDSGARVFVTATLTGHPADGTSPVAVGYLLTLRRTAAGWRVTGVAP